MATPRATGTNHGPFTLQHDLTPKDLSHLNQQSGPATQGNFRFKGYPDGSFESSRIPILGGLPSHSLNTSQNYGRPQHFVKDPITAYDFTRRNYVAGSAPSRLGFHGYEERKAVATSPRDIRSSQPVSGTDQGVLYSSDAVPINKQTPTPKKTLFMSNTLSAEARKKVAQKKEADDDIARFKELKRHQQIEQSEEKRKDLEMLKNYQPFGRPGGGAPHNIHKRTKVIETMKVDDKTAEESPVEPNKLEFGKPGAGAPLRTDSGKLKTNIRSDKEIHFQVGKAGFSTINNHKRYTTEVQLARKYHNELENLSLEHRTQREIEKYNDKLSEREMLGYNPFGKPGAGAPIKTESGRVKAGRALTLTNNHLEQRNISFKHPSLISDSKNPSQGDIEKPILWDITPINGNNGYNDRSSEERSPDMEADHSQENKYNPWGKGFGAPERDSNGNVRRYKWGDSLGVREIVDRDTVGVSLETKPYGGGGQHIDEKGEKITRMKITMEQAKTGEPVTKEAVPTVSGEYNPWGRPGNGAPIKTDSGKLVSTTAGAITSKTINSPYNAGRYQAKQEYLKELQKEMHTQQQIRHEQEVQLKANSGEEVADWVRRGQVGNPKKDPITGTMQPHHKQTSDIVSHRLDIRRDRYPDYHTDLERQAFERSKQQNVDKKQSALLNEKHLQTMDQMWGRPGAGAPVNQMDHRKQPLDLEKVRDPQPSEKFYPTWMRTDLGKPNNKPWVKTKSLNRRFHSPKEIFGTQRASLVRAPWAVYTI